MTRPSGGASRRVEIDSAASFSGDAPRTVADRIRGWRGSRRRRGRGVEGTHRRGGEEREDAGDGGAAVEAAGERVGGGREGPRRVSRGRSRKSDYVDVARVCHPDRRDAGDALGVGGGADGRVAARDGLGGDLSRDGGAGDESGHGGEGGGEARGGEVRCGVRDAKRA